jgi:multidrug efflux pump subunit AcrA (membrane-fusion protein)
MLKRAPSIAALAVLGLLLVAIGFYGGLFGANRPTPSPTRTPSSAPPTVVPSSQPTPNPTAEPTEPPTPRLSPTPLDTSVRAAAVVVPQRSADLAMSVTGLVSSIYVHEGDDVTIGQLLLKLDESGYLAEVDVAEASVRRAEAAV